MNGGFSDGAAVKDLAHYRSLPYMRKVEPRTDEDGAFYWLAWIEEIPFIKIHGATREEALANLQELFDDSITYLIEDGETIPEPPLWPAERKP